MVDARTFVVLAVVAGAAFYFRDALVGGSGESAADAAEVAATEDGELTLSIAYCSS